MRFEMNNTEFRVSVSEAAQHIESDVPSCKGEATTLTVRKLWNGNPVSIWKTAYLLYLTDLFKTRMCRSHKTRSTWKNLIVAGGPGTARSSPSFDPRQRRFVCETRSCITGGDRLKEKEKSLPTGSHVIPGIRVSI
jgi:hypothetical protein